MSCLKAGHILSNGLKITIFSFSLAAMSFAEISRKFSAVRWFDKTEDCIFPRFFILRSNVQSFNILPSFNLTIYLAVFSQSIAIHNLFKPIFYIYRIVSIYLLFSGVHTRLRVSETNAIKCLSHPDTNY